MNKAQMKKNIVLVIACIAAVSMHAQKIGDQVKKTRDIYFLTKQFSCEVEAYSYPQKSSLHPELISKGTIKKDGKNYYSSFNKCEMMIIDEKAVIVDHREKKMTYYQYKVPQQKFQGPETDLDKLIAQTDSVVVRPEKNGEKHFTSFSKKGFIRQTEFYIDAQTNFVTHILYYYVPSTEDYEIEVDRVEVFYKNFKTGAAASDTKFFTLDNYFKYNKSKLVPVAKLQGYQIKYYNSKS